MAMSAALTQQYPATLGNETNFTLAISNSAGTAVTVNTIQAMVLNGTGAPLPTMPFAIGQPVLSPAAGAGGTAGIVVNATSTVYVTFTVQFFGHVVTGGPATPSNVFLVGANLASSDGSVFSPGALTVALSSPTLGQPGSPPDPLPAIGQLIFSTPATSGLTL